jgi:hypothetical protein
MGFEPTRLTAHCLANRPDQPYSAILRVLGVRCRVSELASVHVLSTDTRPLTPDTLVTGPGGSRTHHTDLARVSRPQRHAGPLVGAFGRSAGHGNRTRVNELMRLVVETNTTARSTREWNRTTVSSVSSLRPAIGRRGYK